MVYLLPWLLFWPQTNPAALPQLNACAESLQRGQAQQAVRACKEAVGIDGQSGAAHLLLGQAYLALRSASMIAEAKAELQQALDLDPGLVWGRFYLAKVYLDTGRPDKAKGELEQALKTRPGVAHFLSLMGEAERKLGAPEAALVWHRKALEADPKMNTVHYYAALAYRDLKKDDEAIGELEASIQSPFVAPELYLTLGALYTQRKRYREAEDLCRKAIALDPAHAESYLNLAQLFNAQGLSSRALAALHQALPPGKTFPTSPYYQALQADIHFEFGRAYAAKGSSREAIAAYLRCLSLDAGRAVAHRNLAELYRAQGDGVHSAEQAALAGKLEGQK
ncbi:MAG: tetratricopeptide repeat protein [Candidatus Solibacter sp.]|nr:tetratricopeptide repeat protein [Candidatus Solibacter sp.]